MNERGSFNPAAAVPYVLFVTLAVMTGSLWWIVVAFAWWFIFELVF